MNNKQLQVKEILLTPIIASQSVKSISLITRENTEEKFILSGQEYDSTVDEDMSDISIGFYEIIYKDLFCDSILTKEKITNKEFAGDTMNTFNSIANITKGAGASQVSRAPFNQWPDYLQEYFRCYHCLANFWLIPSDFGRISKKLNYFDSMDIFLHELKFNYADILSNYPCYLEKINDFETFCNVHFVEYTRDKNEVLNLYKKNSNKSKELVSNARGDIDKRAEKIATSKYYEKLLNYFNSLGLVK